MDCPIGPTILMDIILPRSSKYNHSPYVAGEENWVNEERQVTWHVAGHNMCVLSEEMGGSLLWL